MPVLTIPADLTTHPLLTGSYQFIGAALATHGGIPLPLSRATLDALLEFARSVRTDVDGTARGERAARVFMIDALVAYGEHEKATAKHTKHKKHTTQHKAKTAKHKAKTSNARARTSLGRTKALASSPSKAKHIAEVKARAKGSVRPGADDKGGGGASLV